MTFKNAFTIVTLVIAIGLMAPLSAWTSARGHYRSESHYRYAGHHGYSGDHGYSGHHGYSGYHRYPRNYAPSGYSHYPRFYGPSGYSLRGVASHKLGALDLNVKPKNTKVYLNGRHIGKADKFDGAPRFLWLKEGTYELIFYSEGYKTVRKEFTIEAGTRINVKQRLQSGESAPPEAVN